jgi:hypothetical protein
MVLKWTLGCRRAGRAEIYLFCFFHWRRPPNTGISTFDLTYKQKSASREISVKSIIHLMELVKQITLLGCSLMSRTLENVYFS